MRKVLVIHVIDGLKSSQEWMMSDDMTTYHDGEKDTVT
jgi:hypothetical protein